LSPMGSTFITLPLVRPHCFAHRRNSPFSMAKPNGLSCKKRTFRKVGFQPQIKLLSFPLTDSDIQKTWYTQKDYQVFGKDVKATVRVLRKGNMLDVCSRGLEKYQSMKFHDEKKRREQTHYQTILLEQERQRQEGRRNPKILRMLSTVNSQWALQNALLVAQRDAAEVQRIEKEESSPQHEPHVASVPSLDESNGSESPIRSSSPVDAILTSSSTLRKPTSC